MHRITIVLALLVVSARPAVAQAPSATRGRLSLGPFAGLNYTKFGGNDGGDSDSRTDFAIGGQIDYDFVGGALFRTGLIYSRRGAETSDAGTTVAIKLSYLEVPILVGYQFPTTSSVRPYFLGGLNAGFKTGCSFEGSNGSSTASIACDDPNIGANMSSTDFALVGGAGLSLPIGLSSVRLDVRYAYGLTNVAKDADTKNRGFTFGLAYMIPMGR
ncbi:MAG: porin family protein [Gemmatimonadaceae bacterium]